jgi:hypothetical protein
MKSHRNLMLLLALFPIHTGWAAEKHPMKPMIYATEHSIVAYDSSGTETFHLETGAVSRDVWLLENGNILFPYYFKKGDRAGQGGVREVNQKGETVWEFDAKGWTLSCQRLPDGNTLVGAAGQCALLVVNPAGQIINKINVKMRTPHQHSLTMARQLDNGNFLVAEETMKLIREYDPKGKVVWEFETPFTPFSVVRLHSGNTLFSGQHGLIEVTAEKKIIWTLTRSDVEAMGVRWFAGIQVLHDGHVLICNAGGRVPFFEVNREKEVVWQSPLSQEHVGLGHGIYLTEFKGTVIR